ncbi:SufS family cysteine desulfurase [bacterium]|nr:SufS family cysteine desulfurase [bacterium]
MTILKPLNTTEIRSRFPVLSQVFGGKPLTYLDSTATTHKPKAVVDLMADYMLNANSSVRRGVYQLSEKSTQHFEKARKKIAEFIGAETEDEIIFTKGTTDSLNIAAGSLAQEFLKEGDVVLISSLEHHANIVPWQMACKRSGATLSVIPVLDNGELDQEAFKNLLSPKVKVFSITHIANSIGTVNPIKEMIADFKAITPQGIAIVDAAQSVAHVSIDVKDLGCDLFAFSGHKMYGPSGIGVLYGSFDVLKSMPPVVGGGEMIDRVTFEESTYALPPMRFEAGTPAVAEVIGMTPAIEFLEELGLESIHAHETELAEFLRSELEKMEGVRVLGPGGVNQAPVVSFVMDYAHAHDVAMILDDSAIAVRAGHHCAQPTMDRYGVSATLRASFGAYNTLDDVGRFLTAIKRVEKLFK